MRQRYGMSKHDWLLLMIRAVGLYLIATHFGSLVVTGATLIAFFTQKGNIAMLPTIVWQTPAVSLIVVGVGVFFFFQARHIAAAVERND